MACSLSASFSTSETTPDSREPFLLFPVAGTSGCEARPGNGTPLAPAAGTPPLRASSRFWADSICLRKIS